VKLAVRPVPISSVEDASPCIHLYVHGVALHSPVAVNVVASLRTAGAGETVKSAVGGAASHAVVVVVCVVVSCHVVPAASRRSILILYCVPQSSPRIVTDPCVTSVTVNGGKPNAAAVKMSRHATAMPGTKRRKWSLLELLDVFEPTHPGAGWGSSLT
jgi:hypothetical protein